MEFNPYDSDTFPDPIDDQPFGFDENGNPIWEPQNDPRAYVIDENNTPVIPNNDPQSLFIDNEPRVQYGTIHPNSFSHSYVLPQINQRSNSVPTNFNDRYDEEPNIHTANDVDCVVMTSLDKLSEVLATRTFFHGGRLSEHVSRHRGCIILPLSAITQIRKPTGNHIANPMCIIYHEIDPNQNYHDICPNFAQAADVFMQ